MDTDMQLHRYALNDLLPRENNPNHMSDEQFNLLVGTIRKFGFLEPIVVEPLGDGRARITDGEHRAKALAVLGATHAPCVHGTEDPNGAVARAIRIAKNRLRGSLNLSEVASELADLKNAGWTVEELTTTGFAADEVGDLLKAMQPIDQDIIEGVGDAQNTPADTTEEGTYTLEVPFTDRKQMAKARRALRKAAGPGGTLGDGLLTLLEGN